MEKERKIVASLIQTPDGTILWSRFTHDYVQYHDQVSDEDYMLDGGSSYRRTFVNQVKPKDMSVFSDDPWDLQRQYILRGTFNSEGLRVWVPLCKLSNDHIKALADMSSADSRYHQELQYRKKHNINIADHDYKNEGVEAITHTKE